jgi:hypothetical protein
MKRVIAAVTLAIASLPAFAGWYEVTNYEGMIGTYPVHLSVQTFKWLNGNDAKERGKVVGSYYYDARRLPIALHGREQPDGSLRLCEAQDLKAMTGYDLHPQEKLSKDPCPFALTLTPAGATGTWQNGKTSYDVTLKRVGSLNNTEKDVLVGKMEVPMWDHSSTHMYLGVYGMDEDRAIMRSVRAVNIATGKVDQVAELACKSDDFCEPGTVYTDIYMNVSKTSRANKVWVGYTGGKMGTDEEITLKAVK